MNNGSERKKIAVYLDGDTAEWLAARIDDAQPTLKHVAEGVLRAAVLTAQDQLGWRTCRCEALEELADEPSSPICFDATTNEYHLLRQTPVGPAKYIVRYCIQCGGKAPESKRAQLFSKVDMAESDRLSRLCAGISTFEDALSRFGPPDTDHAMGQASVAKTEEGAETITPRRAISYRGLSDTANVTFTQKVGDFVMVSFSGRYIGASEKPERSIEAPTA